MPMNVNRWLQYAKAKLDDTLASGNDELDRLEARREADRADRPWIASDGDAPSFDEARARIAWEADQAAAAERGAAGDVGSTGRGSSPTDAPDQQALPGAADRAETRSAGLPTDPRTPEEAAERSAAQIALDQQAAASAARLAAIRAELGVDDPAPPAP